MKNYDELKTLYDKLLLENERLLGRNIEIRSRKGRMHFYIA